MKRDRIATHVLLAFGVVLAVYLAAFYSIEHLRTRKGGWHVTFQTDAMGAPALLVAEPHLGISNIVFAFPGQRLALTNLARTIVFDRPITNAPFGQIIYLDTTFLPGAIVFRLFDHEIQLVPRVLIVDRREIPWASAGRMELAARPEKAP